MQVVGICITFCDTHAQTQKWLKQIRIALLAAVNCVVELAQIAQTVILQNVCAFLEKEIN